MTSKLIPKNPAEVMVIRDVTPNIFTCSVPFTRFGQIRIGGRGTVVKLSTGALAVFSPVALTPDVQKKIQTMGNDLKYIAALDFEHHIFLGEWHKAFPNAHVIGPEGLAEKRLKDPEMIDVPFSTVFTKENKHTVKISEEFDRDFEYEYVDSHPNKEIVFNYKPDKTLIEADYLFNLPATEQYSKTGEPSNIGILTKLFGSLQSTHGSAIGQKRLIWYGMSRGDRLGFNQSAERIDSWDFNKIIHVMEKPLRLMERASLKKCLRGIWRERSIHENCVDMSEYVYLFAL